MKFVLGAAIVVGVGLSPKLAHLVEVTQTPPRGPPLHSTAVVDERQTWPGGAVMPGFEGSVGKPPPLLLVVLLPLPLPPFSSPSSVGLGLAGSKPGAVPLGLGTQ